MGNVSESSTVSSQPKASGGSLVNSIRKDFNTMTWVLIPVAIAINIVIGQLVLFLKLPVFLDSTGTILVAVLCGPWAGALTGALSNFVAGVIFDPSAWWPWFPVAAVIGLVAGICAKYGLFKTWSKVLIAGFLIALAAAITSVPISVYLYGGITASGSSFITAYLLQTGRSVVSAVFSTNFLVEPFDKIATSLLAFAIIQGLSRRYISRFPRPENVALEQQVNRRKELIIAVIVSIALILVYSLILYNLLGMGGE